MAEITITINGRNYGIACDDGQERRVQDLARYVDGRLREIARAGAASNESHLLVLTAIILADEIADMRSAGAALERQVASQQPASGVRITEDEEETIVSAIDLLAARIDQIAVNLQKL
ncbi:MAG: cell division protein ZapA [Micavibrio aeruginosavorus]|uniref:Cell division protein ZapA n=1 Tax=Micavibrio aeruginosavorus TaxID=349221 RepID=A0A2W5BAC0_9BACT|nr:MAG: cell division protein ZapA [Micavibrio aeruginosavorus]